MERDHAAVRKSLRTPRAAAVAGIVFSLLLIASMWLMWLSIPADPFEASTHWVRNSARISISLELLPFAGIAFLWFVGVLRDRLGDLEDRFFATVFLGSGLLFLAMMFVAAATAGGLLRLVAHGGDALAASGPYLLGRVQVHQTMHVYALKMAGVFMVSTATISLRTGIVPRWMAYLGYALAAVLLTLGVGVTRWAPMAFPLWILLISAYILIDNLRGAPAVDPRPDGRGST